MPANPAAGISGSCVLWFDRSAAAADSNLARFLHAGPVTRSPRPIDLFTASK